jgi:hypothetical protein
MDINQLKARYTELGLSKTPRPLNEAELEALEEKMGVTFPAVYRDFLQWFGSGVGVDDLFGGATCSFPNLETINQQARELLEEEEAELELPQNAIVCWQSGNEMAFHFILPNEGDDPPVYYYEAGMSADTFPRSHPSFSEFLSQHIEAEGRRRQYCRQFWQADQNVIQPTNYLADLKEFWRTNSKPAVVGCTEQEIFILEQQYGFVLLPTYREFLLWTGHSTELIWPNHHSTYNSLMLSGIRSLALAYIEIENPNLTLPDDAVVFLFAVIPTEIYFFRMSEGANPPVYRFYPDSDATKFTISSSDFVSFLKLMYK